MGDAPLARRLLAEALGTAFLLATVIGSGITGAKLAGGNQALALLGNTLSTGAILVVLIDVVCQPCRHDRARSQRHLRRHHAG